MAGGGEGRTVSAVLEGLCCLVANEACGSRDQNPHVLGPVVAASPSTGLQDIVGAVWDVNDLQEEEQRGHH